MNESSTGIQKGFHWKTSPVMGQSGASEDAMAERKLHISKAPEVTRDMSSGAEPSKEKENEDHARLPAQVPASHVFWNPSGNDRQERMDAVSGQKDGKHRADNAWARQQDRQIRRAAAF